MNERIRIVLADDHGVAREGIGALLRSESDLEIVGEAESGSRAVELATELEPDVLIMDIRMPGGDGLEATQRIAESMPQVEVIVLSILRDPAFVTRALKNGAAGYVAKSSGARELVAAIREVAAGGRYLSECLRASPLLAGAVANPETIPAEPAQVLSPRETEVLALLAEGKGSHEIGRHLGIAESTVAAHRRSIMRKLGAASTAELVRAALQARLSSVD